jgi:pimeloyl-ACP methyl ester carboxylesterase
MSFTAPPRRLGTLDRPDCRIAYEVTGSGPPIVFAHGLGGCYLSWFQQVAHFAPRYTCVSFSHRGFFPSTAPAGGPDPRDYAGDLAALVDHLELGDIALVCQSMGGWTGVEYALAQPGRLRALVLAATTGSLDPRQMREPARGRLEGWTKQSAAARAAMQAAHIHPAGGPAMAERQPAQHHLYAALDRLSAGLDKEALRARMTEMRRRPPADLAAGQCPVLFMPNGQDQVIPPFALEAMAPEIPGAKVARIPDAAHSAYFETPAAFNALVEAFLIEVGHSPQ